MRNTAATRGYRWRLLLGAGLISWAGGAMAQSAPDQSPPAPVAATDSGTAIPDIVVTAQRRSEKLQDVPIAVTAITAGALKAKGVSVSTDLAQTVSGLTLTDNSGYVEPRLRGVGNNVIGLGYEGGVATYIDGVYIGSAPASLMSLSNVERVEVLKGPQGTLFGRNATGGLIQVVTREPSDHTSGDVALGYGNYGTYSADAYVTGGLADGLSADLAGHDLAMQRGYGKNLYNGQDVYKTDDDLAVRSSILFKRGGTKIRISFDYADLSGSMFTALTPAPGAPVYFQNAPQVKGWDVDNDYQPYYRYHGGGVAGTVNQDLGAMRLTSITAYRRSYTMFDQDTDGTGSPGLDIHLTQDDRQFSQEVQLSSAAGSKINWVLGSYYFHATGITDPTNLYYHGIATPIIPLGVNGTPPLATVPEQINQATTKTDALAAFAQATLPVADRTNLTMGIRYSTEKRSLDSDSTTILSIPYVPYPVDNVATSYASKRFSDPTWRISLDHHFSDELMTYVSYNRGFKSGGYNAALASAAPFQPEQIDAYEVGFKSTLLNRRLRFNAAAFYYNYRDIQVGGFDLGQIYYYNGGRARIYGLEGEVEARVTSAFRLSGGFTLLNDSFTDFPDAVHFTGFDMVTTVNAAGNKLPMTATFTGNIAGNYTIPVSIGKLDISVSYAYNSGYYTEVDNDLHQGRFGFLNAGVGLQLTNGLGLRGWVRNAANVRVTNSMNTTSLGATTNFQPPRTYGVTLDAHF